MQTLKFKAQPTNAFFATVNQMFGGSFQLPAIAEKHICRLSFEFYSPLVIEKRSNLPY